MSQPDVCSGSSNFVNQQPDYVNLRSNFINQPALEPDKPDNYVALQSTGSSQNEYKRLKQVNCRRVNLVNHINLNYRGYKRAGRKKYKFKFKHSKFR